MTYARLRTLLVIVPALFVATPAHADDTATTATTERNSLPMMITGIGLSVLGVGSIGGGIAARVKGARDCDAAGQDAAVDSPGLYQVARNHCRDTSGFLPAGTALMVGGSVLAAAGVAFTIAGAWKIVVHPGAPKPTASLRIGPSFTGLVGTF